MDKELDKIHFILRYELSELNYFESILSKAFEKGMIDLEIITNLQIQFLELLNYKVERYNNFSSSSISNDIAKMIMDSNLYVVSLYLKDFEPYEAIEEIKNKKIMDLYSCGRKIIDKKLFACKILYKKIIKNLNEVNNETYNMTIREGIKGFFKIYDPDYNARDFKITADYPLYNNIIGKLEGIEFIQKYLESIYYENEFCNFFGKNNIQNFCNMYSENFEVLIINILKLVLTQSIGCVLAEMNYINLLINSQQIKSIYELFDMKTREEVYDLIDKACSKIEIKNEQIKKYINNGIEDVKAEIYNGYVLGNLEKIFVCVEKDYEL